MRKTDLEIIDAEFRVVRRSRVAGWIGQLEVSTDRLAFLCGLLAPLILICGLLLGFFHFAFLAAALVVTVGCLVSTEWKRYGMLGLGVTALLAISACSPRAAEPSRAMLASEKDSSPVGMHASIREATKYRDPREGWDPKGIDILNGEMKADNARSASDEAH